MGWLFRTTITLYTSFNQHETIKDWYTNLGMDVKSDLDEERGDAGPNWFLLQSMRRPDRVAKCRYYIKRKEHVTAFLLVWSEFLMVKDV